MRPSRLTPTLLGLGLAAIVTALALLALRLGGDPSPSLVTTDASALVSSPTSSLAASSARPEPPTDLAIPYPTVRPETPADLAIPYPTVRPEPPADLAVPYPTVGLDDGDRPLPGPTFVPALWPVADAASGAVVGHDRGSPMEPVMADLLDRLGQPDTDQWGEPCVGGLDELERLLWWGRLIVRFVSLDGDYLLDGWAYSSYDSYDHPAELGPSPDEIDLHPGVQWGNNVAQVAERFDVSSYSDDLFEFTTTGVDGATYSAGSNDPAAAFDHVSTTTGGGCDY